jgi:cold shock CspA family protein
MSAWKAGTVRYFDDKKGRGYIVCEDGEIYTVHYSAIDSDSEWKSLKENSKVKFQKLNDEDYKMVKAVKEV